MLVAISVPATAATARMFYFMAAGMAVLAAGAFTAAYMQDKKAKETKHERI